jgi:phage shock protein A
MDLQNDLLVSKDLAIDTLRADNSDRFKKIEALNQELNQAGNQLAQLQNHVDGLVAQNHTQQQRIERVTGELDRLLDLARAAVEESLSEWDTRLSSLVNTKREQYPKLAERLNQLLEEAQQKLAEYAVKLAQTPKKWDSLGDLLSLYYVANDDLQNIRVKAVQSIAKLTNQETLLELQEYQTAIQEWEGLD